MTEPTPPDEQITPVSGTAEKWYSVDHYDSDSSYHVYCGICYNQIPAFLIRWDSEIKPPYIYGGEKAECDGCQKTAP
jgi:hypothetical protein